MTQYRLFLAAILALFVLSACNGGNNEMKTDGTAAEATETTTEQADTATTEAADKAATATQEATQESGAATDTQQTTTN